MGDGLLSVAAHTIGHREIIFNENTQNSIIVTNGDEDYGYSYFGNTGVTGNSFYSDSSTDKRNTSSDLFLFRTGMGNSDSVNLNSSINNTNTTRQVVVISVRGSVTPLNWLVDFLTQFHVCLFDFETDRDMVLKSLYGCDGNCIGNGSNSRVFQVVSENRRSITMNGPQKLTLKAKDLLLRNIIMMDY